MNAHGKAAFGECAYAGGSNSCCTPCNNRDRMIIRPFPGMRRRGHGIPVARPLGGIVLGRVGDTHGRKTALLITIALLSDMHYSIIHPLAHIRRAVDLTRSCAPAPR